MQHLCRTAWPQPYLFPSKARHCSSVDLCCFLTYPQPSVPFPIDLRAFPHVSPCLSPEKPVPFPIQNRAFPHQRHAISCCILLFFILFFAIKRTLVFLRDLNSIFLSGGCRPPQILIYFSKRLPRHLFSPYLQLTRLIRTQPSTGY